MRYAGGVIGKLLDQSSKISFIGGTSRSAVGSTTNITIDFSTIASLKENDFVIVAHAIPNNIRQTPNVISSGYTTLRLDYVNGTSYDTNFRVSYKTMGAIPDANIIFGASNNTSAGTLTGVMVFRNVDIVSPFDIASNTSNAVGTNIVNPAAITPVSRNAMIVVIGTGSYSGPNDIYTTTGLENAYTVGLSETNSDGGLALAIYKQWTSGVYDPAAWTNTQATNLNQSYSSITMALRPQLPKAIVSIEDVYNAGST
jgi:hypothetical protein